MIKSFNPDSLHRDLLEKRTIYLGDRITDELASQFGMVMVWLNKQNEEPIDMYFDSPGGSVAAGLDIYDMVRHSKAPVTGIIYRHADSMAAVIIQGCTTRQALPNADLLIHGVRISDFSLISIEDDIEKALRKAREQQSIINTILHERTGLSLSAIRKMNRQGKTISATEAFSLGLIDEILWPQ